MKHLFAIVLCLLLCGTAGAQRPAAVRDTNLAWCVTSEDNMRSVGSISNVSCVEGRIYYNNAGVLFSAPMVPGAIAEVDTHFLKVDREMNYVVQRPVSSQIYYTKSGSGGKSLLYRIVVDQRGRGKSEAVRLPHFKGTVVHPTFSQDGRIMVFSSNESRSHGGYDLWYSLAEGDEWSTPINLGGNINTAGHEFSPAIWGDYLFFSTNRGDTLRDDYDIYATRLVSLYKVHGDTVTSFPIGLSPILRLPAPLNSDMNDFGIAFSPDADRAFFVSRLRGESSDRIFRLDGPMVCVNYRGQVESYTAPGEGGLDGASITIMSDPRHSLYTARCDSEGRFSIYLPTGHTYLAKTSAPNHLSATESLEVSEGGGEELIPAWRYTPTLHTYARRKFHPFQAQSIFGSESGSDITIDGETTIEPLVRFLQENPRLRLSITAVYGRHQSDSFCSMLNSRRLQSLLQSFARQGINAAAIDTRSIVGVYKRTESDPTVYDNVILFLFDE